MALSDVYRDCDGCGGTGEESGMSGIPPAPATVPCAKCSGTGRLTLGHISEDLITLFNDMNDKLNDIKEKCDEIFDEVKP